MATSSRNKEFKPLVALSNQDDVLIDFNERIGEWAYGSLYKGYSKNQNKQVMVKVIDLKKFPLPKSCLDTEVMLLKKLQGNKYFVKFAEYRFYENTLTLTTEICNRGSLRSHLKKRSSLPEGQALHLLLQIIHGLKALHDLNYSHGAVRPENILLHEENNSLVPKLTTLVFAKQYNSESLSRSLFPYDSLYLSPETLKNQDNGTKSDLWALGVLYYEMLYGTTPWVGKDMKELEKNIIHNNLEFPEGDSISEASTSFISKCLDRDAAKRLNWSDVMQHRLVFRGMFAKGNGTYKVLNDEFKEETPLSGKLMYGLKRESTGPSLGHSRTKSWVKTSSVMRLPFEVSGPDMDASNIRISTVGFDYGTHILDTKEDFTMENLADTTVKSIVSPVKTATKKVMTARGHQPTKSIDGRFYTKLVSSVATTDDFFTLKTMNSQKSAGKNSSSAHKAHTSPFRQLSFKAEMLGELCQLIQENKEYPLYDKILKVLEAEAQKLNDSMMHINNISQNFKKRIESSVNQSITSKNGSLSVRNQKVTQSIPKKVKSKEIHELLKEMLVNLMATGKTDGSTNMESIITIAASLKVLREFEEVGEDVSKKLESLKDILQMFYRQKHYDHLKYLILVKNLV